MSVINQLTLPPADLSPHETRELIHHAQQGNKIARDRLIQANLRLVMSLVQRYERRGVDLDDLFQVGCLGLVKAIEHFDLSFQVRFSTYAVPRILGEIRRYMQTDKTIKVGRSLHDLAVNAGKAREALTQELGRSPTVTELAEHLGVQREDIVTALESALPPASVDEVIYQDEGNPIRLGDQVGVESKAGDVVNNIALRQVFATLSSEERQLVVLRFFEEMRQVDVAKQLGVSQAHVSRLETRLLRKMRAMMA